MSYFFAIILKHPVEDSEIIDKIEYDPTDGTHEHFLAIPRLQEVQLSLSKREEELKTSKLPETKQKERKNKALYDSVDQKNLVQFSRPEHFLAWYQSVDQMDKSIPGGFDTANIVVHMLKGSIRLPEDKGKVELMNTQLQVMQYMNGKYLAGTNVVMITFGDLNKLSNPNKFSTAISNCEKVLECVIMITTVGLDNKINENHLTTMEERCLVLKRRTTYYEAKATWLGRDEIYVSERDDILAVAETPARRASVGDRESAAPAADRTRSGGIGDMTQQIANLQADTSNKENIKFFVHYIKKEMRIMRLQLASEGELEHYPNTRQGGGDIERVHPTNQQDGRPQYSGQDGRPLKMEEVKEYGTRTSLSSHVR